MSRRAAAQQDMQRQAANLVVLRFELDFILQQNLSHHALSEERTQYGAGRAPHLDAQFCALLEGKVAELPAKMPAAHCVES